MKCFVKNDYKYTSKCKHINTNINQLKLMKTMCLLIRLDEKFLLLPSNRLLPLMVFQILMTGKIEYF
ncbi:hypothetical protein EAG08_00950 [Chryseobacterium sp. 3008163]|nr:hypothetical protein EAG08_00950 [Chryseobacterium sp. 3008163]